MPKMQPSEGPAEILSRLSQKARDYAGHLKKSQPQAETFSALASNAQSRDAALVAKAPLLPSKAGPAPSSDPKPPYDPSLGGFRDQVCECARCPLSKSRKKFVFGEGNPRASLVLIGDAPGADEDLQGRPFVGPAGQLLTRILAAMNLRRDDVYLMNLVKCRPQASREPAPAELDACRPYWEHQLSLIKPKAICTLGSQATQALGPGLPSLDKARGSFFDYKGIPVMPTYHPSYLLKNEAAKRQVWDDMKALLKRLDAEK